MKVDTRDIQGIKKIEISGTEPWLEAIYGYFRSEKGDSAKLTGSFELSYFDLMDAYKVKFSFNYTPKIDCSRCGIKIDWPIFAKKELYFYCGEDRSAESSTMESDSRDLDAYFVEDGKIDIEDIVNETVHLSIPTTTVLTTKDKPSDCSVCGIDVSDDQVYGVSKEDDPTNPFAALKKLQKPN